MTPESCLNRLNSLVDGLLQKEQPPLFAWHLRSLKSLAQAEYAKLQLKFDQRGHTVADRTKEFVDDVTKFNEGLARDCDNPDEYLKNGRRSLVLARLSQIDGTLQYMMVGLPKNWDPNKAYPLAVGLHGTGPDYPLTYPSYTFGVIEPPKAGVEEKPAMPVISLTPWGRGNRGWRGDGESDLFEAIDLLETFAKLDNDRWYLSGHSAGADGAWAILQHTPDLWAAAGMQSGSMLSGRPEWGLIPNMKYVPVHLLIGENDNLPYRIPDMKEAYRILTEMGDQTKLVILPGIGHYPLTDEALKEQFDWMARFVRKRPDKFSFTVDQAIHPGVWGIRVVLDRATSRLIKEPWPSFECDIKGQEVHIKTQHLKQLRINLGPDGLRMSGAVKVWVNGKQVHDGPVPDNVLEVHDL